MAVDYDLVAIGNSFEGIYAATAAIRLNARVALVYSSDFRGTADAELFYSRAVPRPCWQEVAEEERLSAVRQWAKEAIAPLSTGEQLAALATLGVDVIEGEGEFCRLPQQALVVGKRQLRSRAYLLATGSHSALPESLEPSLQAELQEMGYLTVTSLWQRENLHTLPKRLLVLGGSSIALELSQSLARWGKEVTLAAGNEVLLPTADREAARWLQAQLEADGVRILTRSPITQIREIDGAKWVQAGNVAAEVDEIIVAAEYKPNVAGLNLEGVGVKFEGRSLLRNEKLQTTNPQIYACGSVAGGSCLPHIARSEVDVALKNALFIPMWKVDRDSIPQAILTEPNLARVGMTEEEARRRYGKDIIVVRQDWQQVPQALISGETTGFCKFVLLGNGTFVGAHIVGSQAGEFIGTVALAMKHGLKVTALANLPQVSPTFSEILRQTALEWERDRLRRNTFLVDLRDRWFRWRRNGSS